MVRDLASMQLEVIKLLFYCSNFGLFIVVCIPFVVAEEVGLFLFYLNFVRLWRCLIINSYL